MFSVSQIHNIFPYLKVFFINSEKWIAICDQTLSCFFFYLGKATVFTFNSNFNRYFQQLFVPLKYNPHRSIHGSIRRVWPGQLLNLESTTQTYQEHLQAHHSTFQQSNSQLQTANEFLISPYLIFSMLWDKRLWRAFYLSDVINKHQWKWDHRKT